METKSTLELRCTNKCYRSISFPIPHTIHDSMHNLLQFGQTLIDSNNWHGTPEKPLCPSCFESLALQDLPEEDKQRVLRDYIKEIDIQNFLTYYLESSTHKQRLDFFSKHIYYYFNPEAACPVDSYAITFRDHLITGSKAYDLTKEEELTSLLKGTLDFMRLILLPEFQKQEDLKLEAIALAQQKQEEEDNA